MLEKLFTKKIAAFSMILTSILVCSGCSFAIPRISVLDHNGWVADYESAERKVRETGNALLLFYKSGQEDMDSRIQRALDDPQLKTAAMNPIRCVLFHSYEPNRRYVAQFGVQRAPALILVHPDGTYHATEGSMQREQIAQFLTLAIPPGTQPKFNPYLPRVPEYFWHDTMDTAIAHAKKIEKPLFIIYERTFSGDWKKLQKLLTRREVFHRIAPMVHTRISVPGLFTDSYHSPFGVLQLPAIVIAKPGGSFCVLELPTTYESVVRFTDRSLTDLAETNTHKETVSSDIGP